MLRPARWTWEPCEHTEHVQVSAQGCEWLKNTYRHVSNAKLTCQWYRTTQRWAEKANASCTCMHAQIGWINVITTAKTAEDVSTTLKPLTHLLEQSPGAKARQTAWGPLQMHWQHAWTCIAIETAWEWLQEDTKILVYPQTSKRCKNYLLVQWPGTYMMWMA